MGSHGSCLLSSLFVRARNFQNISGRRISTARFCSSVEGAQRDIASWHIEKFECTCVALEFDTIANKKLTTKLFVDFHKKEIEAANKKKKVADGDEEPLEPTTVAKVQIDDKALRSVAVNACAVKCLHLSDMTHKRLTTTIVACTKEVRQFAAKAAAVRDETAAHEWFQAFSLLPYLPELCEHSLGSQREGGSPREVRGGGPVQDLTVRNRSET